MGREGVEPNIKSDRPPIDKNTERGYTYNMDEFNKSMNAVLEHGMSVIDKLSDEEIERVMAIFNDKSND
jgi:hypothetical protein